VQAALGRLPTRTRVAFLNSASDLVSSLPEHAHAFLDPLLTLVLAILRLASTEGACPTVFAVSPFE
jgi:hypothetical protein